MYFSSLFIQKKSSLFGLNLKTSRVQINDLSLNYINKIKIETIIKWSSKIQSSECKIIRNVIIVTFFPATRPSDPFQTTFEKQLSTELENMQHLKKKKKKKEKEKDWLICLIFKCIKLLKRINELKSNIFQFPKNGNNKTQINLINIIIIHFCIYSITHK